MWIKICANTNIADALLAANLGAAAVGFVFARSSRHVTAAQVAAITSSLPAHIERIGVFDTQDAPEIIATVREAGLSGIQLHGRFSATLVEELARALGPAVNITQTVHWDITQDVSSLIVDLQTQLRQIRQAPAVSRVLVDSKVGKSTGGTGVAFEWSAAAPIFHAELGHLKLIVAGGLHPDNVQEAIRRLAPWGVDVASGVESSPGRKDPQKLEAFIKKASL